MESERYRRVGRRLNLAVVIANVCGAALITFYFTNLQFSSAQAGDSLDALGTLFTVLVVAGLLVLGNALSGRRVGPMLAWYRQAAAGEVSDPAPADIRRAALNYAAVGAGVTLVMWLLAGVVFGVTTGLDAGPQQFDWNGFLQILFGAIAIVGPVTSALVYFAVEWIWRSELPLFFPKGELSQTLAFRVTVRRRLFIMFAMGTMPLLLLAALTYSQASAMARADTPADLLPGLVRLELFIVGVGALVALILARFLGTSLVEPLEALSREMAAAREGNLERYITVTSNDELGLLAEGFNAMVGGLRREEVIRRLFGLYVTPQVADHAIQHGAELGGQLVEASVLFSDIRGFTSMTERMEPGALIALLNRYFQTISAAVIEHGGLVNKFGGDSLLAVFGTPLNPAEDHPTQAVQAAQGMLAALEAFNQDQARRGEPQVHIGVGVATGPILAGNVGGAERLEYTVIGDAVNLASRLESMTKELDATILVSETTAALVRDWASLSPMGEVVVRGKQEPVGVYALT